MALVWTFIATCLLLSSSIATFLTMLHLRCRWDVHASSVRWLFWFFFACVWVWCSIRSVFFVWMIVRQRIEVVDTDASIDVHKYTYSQLDRLGIHGILYLKDAKKPWITAVLSLGDVALFGIAVTLFPLTYELWRLARKSMDRGVERERRQIRYYVRIISCSLLTYGAIQLALALVFGGYNVYMHRCLLAVYVLQFIALAVMASQLLMLKVNGRKFETIQGTFVASPVYQRLKRIMYVEILTSIRLVLFQLIPRVRICCFVFQFQLSMLIVYLHKVAPDDSVIDFIGVSLMIYNLSGLALSITTSCSQACVFSTCAPCIPEDFEAEFLHQRFAAPRDEDLEAPRANPVFVYTDIQSSTALWNMDSEVMGAATEIHDNILRSSLTKHRGYEITTVGDAFQVAFHTIRDAVEYCLDVQLQLLVADWPRSMHGLVPATTKMRAGRRLLFNGLRVRMGVHDASEDDGRLVKDVHAITGKTTYSGMSEIVAEYVGELGSGGQILVTERVATWLKHHRDDLSIDVFMEHVGVYTVTQVNTAVGIYQVQPAMLAARAQYFKTPEQEPVFADPEVLHASTSGCPRPADPLGAISEDVVDSEQSLASPSLPLVQSHSTGAEPTYKALTTPRQASPVRVPSWLRMHSELTIAA